MKPITGMEWLKKWIKKLEVTSSNYNAEINHLIKIENKIYNEFKEWTPLKLILLNYALDVCTLIIKNTSFFHKRFYVDLFAGSGINKIKGKEDFFIGSPLIEILNHGDAYDLNIFCESDKSFSKALEKRFNFLKRNNIELIKQDYLKSIDLIIEKVKSPNYYSFFFIDPYCMQFSWEAMEKILDVRSDIVLNFMTSQIYRDLNLVKSGIGTGKILNNFFGDNSWSDAETPEELIKIYIKNIRRIRPEAPVRTIKVKSKKFNFYYHILFITNKTSGENKWLRAIDKAKQEIEKNSDVAVQKALDIVKKRQFELNHFYD